MYIFSELFVQTRNMLKKLLVQLLATGRLFSKANYLHVRVSVFKSSKGFL